MVERWLGFTNLPLLEQARARVTRTLIDGIQLNMSTEEAKKIAEKTCKYQNQSGNYDCRY